MGLYSKFNQFLEKHILQHISNPDKCENSLDMLINMFSATHDPFPFHVRRPINWQSNVRYKEPPVIVRDRMKIIFKHLTKNKCIKIMHQLFWKKCVRVFTHLAAQDMNFAFNRLFPLCFDLKRSSPEMMMLGLDVFFEMLKVDNESSFCKQLPLSQENMEKVNRFLSKIIIYCEQNVGLQKLKERINPAMICYNADIISQLNVYETNMQFDTFDEMLVQAFHDDDSKNGSPSKHISQNRKQFCTLNNEEKALLLDEHYGKFSNDELLKLCVTHKDLIAKKIIDARQKSQNSLELEKAAKKQKKVKLEYLEVLKSCIRCVLGTRQNEYLTNSHAQNLTFIGRFLLHPDLEIVMISFSVLYRIVQQDISLLSPILKSLLNYLNQWYINQSVCISVLIQALAILADTFKEHQNDISYFKRSIIEELCNSFHQLDAVALAFYCHTNLNIRYACIQLTKSVANAMEILIKYYFNDKSVEIQEQQMTFPSSLGNFFSLYSDEIMKRAIRKHAMHQDNIKLSVVTSMDADLILPSLINSLLVPFQFAPVSSLMDAIVEKIEQLCSDGSLYFQFLRVDCCQEYLLQPNWLSVDKHSDDKQVLGSMCICLIPVLGFSANGMEDKEFYESIWRQMEIFINKNEIKRFRMMVNTILYSIQSAHSSRMLDLFLSLKMFYEMNFKIIKGNKTKKKTKQEIERKNSKLVWMYNYTVLVLSSKDRLYEAFLSVIVQIDAENEQQKQQYLHNVLIEFCNSINGEQLLKSTFGDSETLRCVSRIVENVASTLLKVYMSTKYEWVLNIWNEEKRCQLLETMKIWSQCNSDPQGRNIINNIRLRSTDEVKDQNTEEKLRTVVSQLEYQAFRTCTALTNLGNAALNEIIEIPGNDENEWKENTSNINKVLFLSFVCVVNSMMKIRNRIEKASKSFVLYLFYSIVFSSNKK